jgi:hypothetical protein
VVLGPSAGRTMNSNAAGQLQNIKKMWLVCNQPRRCFPYCAKTNPKTRASSKAEASGAHIVQRSGSNYITDNAEKRLLAQEHAMDNKPLIAICASGSEAECAQDCTGMLRCSAIISALVADLLTLIPTVHL